MMLNSISIKSFVIRLIASPFLASVNQFIGNRINFEYTACLKSRLTPVRMVANEYNPRYTTAFLRTVMPTMPTQIQINACAAPTSCTYASNIELQRSISVSGIACSSEFAPPWNKIRRKGTTLKKVNNDRNAFSTLHKMFNNRLPL